MKDCRLDFAYWMHLVFVGLITDDECYIEKTWTYNVCMLEHDPLFSAVCAYCWGFPPILANCKAGMWNDSHFVITLVITFLKFISLRFHYIFKWLRNSSQRLWNGFQRLWNGFLVSLSFFFVTLFQKRNRYFRYNVIVSLRFTSRCKVQSLIGQTGSDSIINNYNLKIQSH